jgi:hypothetical protein
MRNILASLNRQEARKIGGGGPPEQLTALQDKVVGILGNTPTEGIGGGTDTLADETTEEPHADSDQTSDFCEAIKQLFAVGKGRGLEGSHI